MNLKILILGAGQLQLPLINESIRQGYYTIVGSPNRDEPGVKVADEYFNVDVTDKQKILEFCKQNKINGICTDQTDLPVSTIAYVSCKMGFPANEVNVIDYFTNKYLMREKCKELGIKTLKYKLCENLSEAETFFSSLGRDAIIKPIDNQGSKGVYKIHTLDDLRAKWKDAVNYSNSHQILVEEFVEGKEFVVESMCFNYEYQMLICGDTHYFNLPDVFSATKRVFPSQQSEKLINKVLEVNELIVKGFGLRQGISHSEYIMAGDDVILIETAARGGGVFISSDLISLKTGLNTEKFILDISLGNINSLPKIKYNDKVCCYLAFFLRKGIISNVQGIEEVLNFEFTHRNNYESIKIGKEIKTALDKTGRYFIIVEGFSIQDLNYKIALIKSTLKIEMNNMGNLIDGIIWE